jgi:thiosulfate reductase cytochrome b subunit
MRISQTALTVLILSIGCPVGVAYLQWAVIGLPPIPAISDTFVDAAAPSGFPAWIRITHYVNFLFIILLVRSGLQILVEHPRLYWNVHCTPNTEWLRLTSIEVPTDRVWTARDDALWLSPWIGLPGSRLTVGIARHWHFLSVAFWVGNGLIFTILLLCTSHWRRLVPTSWSIIPGAWAVFVHYATFHLPPEPNGFYHYNALQQLTYFGVVFVLAPLAIMTGLSMSPALTNRFSWYPKLPGNRQIGRSIHFLIMCAFVIFLIGHVGMVIMTGFAQNMNHIVLGTDDAHPIGMYLGLLGIGVVVLLNALANWLSWRHPRSIQRASRAIVSPIMAFLLDRAAPTAQFGRDDISPFFWLNGIFPESDEWKALAANGFRDYRLKVFGLVENPVEFSLEEIRTLEKTTQITLHHCIQGWSGIAEWGGLPMGEVIRLVRPKPEAQMAYFHSFGGGKDGGFYYDGHSLSNLLHPQSMLAYDMNGDTLSEHHGAPLRLRVENQLGFKMVKWIRAIEFVGSPAEVGEGEGGYKEDHEFFGQLADI